MEIKSSFQPLKLFKKEGLSPSTFHDSSDQFGFLSMATKLIMPSLPVG